jgi:aminoglycoside phosphotransferase (APT) family kinase protein
MIVGGYSLAVIRPEEITINVDQVRRLIAEQFPQWAGLPIVPQPLDGTDNALFRIGGELVARLPRAPWAVDQVRTDATWLPLLAPRLPLPVPVPVAVGQPGADYPWPWTVVPWMPGRNPDPEMDLVKVAVDLAGFVRAMIAIEPLDGPLKEGIARGVPLEQRDELTRRSIAALGSRIDAPAVTAAWDEALDVDGWPGPPAWLHGDLLAGNLLVDGGRLTAVIDFGGLGRGDPAIELLPCWTLFDARAQAAYTEALGFDEATWVRGWAWPLSIRLYWLADLWDLLSEEDREDSFRYIEHILAHRHR